MVQKAIIWAWSIQGLHERFCSILKERGSLPVCSPEGSKDKQFPVVSGVQPKMNKRDSNVSTFFFYFIFNCEINAFIQIQYNLKS